MGPGMRYVRDILLLIVLIGVAYGVSSYKRMQREESDSIEATANETRRLESEIQYRAATKAVMLNPRGFPTTVDPKWFDQRVPENALLTDDRPWLEVAPPEQAGLMHPPVRMTVNKQIASFWYNPYQGVVRARVPVNVSDEAATALYNRVNETSLASIFWIEPVQPTLKPTEQQALAQAGEKNPEPNGKSGAPSSSTPSISPSQPAQAQVPDDRP
jgi:hypothetical protein